METIRDYLAQSEPPASGLFVAEENFFPSGVYMHLSVHVFL